MEDCPFCAALIQLWGDPEERCKEHLTDSLPTTIDNTTARDVVATRFTELEAKVEGLRGEILAVAKWVRQASEKDLTQEEKDEGRVLAERLLRLM